MILAENRIPRSSPNTRGVLQKLESISPRGDNEVNEHTASPIHNLRKIAWPMPPFPCGCSNCVAFFSPARHVLIIGITCLLRTGFFCLSTLPLSQTLTVTNTLEGADEGEAFTTYRGVGQIWCLVPWVICDIHQFVLVQQSSVLETYSYCSKQDINILRVNI